MKVLVFFSGGKDSHGALIWACEKYGVNNCVAVTMDTEWENPITYIHIAEVTKQIGVELVVLKSKKYDGFIDMAKKKGRFPSTKARFCTEELKVKPAIDYVLSHTEHLIAIEGIRADESASRSKMKQDCTYFKYYFEPYQTNSMIVELYESKEFLNAHQQAKLKKAKNRLAIGKEDAKYFTYRKKDVLEWCKIYNCDKFRPFFFDSAFDVIAYIKSKGHKPNPLYYKGAKRVGCFPCVMASLAEIKMIIELFPEMWQRLKDAENFIGRSFFPPDYIPKWACINREWPTCNDVEKYIKEQNATADMFKEETPSCMSVYKLCE